jgi:hypothetical protein
MNNDQLYFYNRGFNDCLAKNLNPVKELTDEEIWKLWQEHLNDDIPVFARAILRKAQEK